ncbi:MAG TPA: cobyric acid synthase [Acidimicrobiales bacterium]|nr:cobyric acid synthase [Acidimicrobiales bacterium]
MNRRPLMVLGCTSTAGKSLLVTALARWFHRQSVDVVPFKAQNMSNNARVVDGGEIGVAQWLQARAAGQTASVDMNPVLLKPEAETRSQVVVDGVARPDLTALAWRERGPHLWPAMAAAYERLSARHELVLIEGAGSPAEINLPDLVNNQVLEHADAAGLLVVDIDRGGAFAHLYGTWSLAPASTRRRLAGFVLNKFRGDAGLLEPGPATIGERTGMAALGVLPLLAHQLPDEEGGTIRADPPTPAPTVSVVRYPYASNLDELYLVPHVARMRWASTPGDLAGADLVILPGSKHVAADAAWLRERRLDHELSARVAAGGAVFAVCGGAMLAGREVLDPGGIEGAADAVGLMPLVTEMEPSKLTRATTVSFPTMPSPWDGLSGLDVDGYEIRNGRVRAADCELAPLVWAHGSVLATTVHGLLESPDVLQALFGTRPPEVLDTTFELLADAIETHLDTAALWRLVG